MKAVILAAGKGIRLSEISKNIPKPMVSINGKPLLQWNIENLKKYGITDIYINLHHLPEKITDYFGDGKKFGVSITYSYEKKLLGTGGALIAFSEHLTDDFVIIYGDVLLNIDFKKLQIFHKKHDSLITAAVHPSSHPDDSDLVNFDKDFKITNITKKPHSKIPKNPYSLAALYMFNPEALNYLLKKTPFDIAHDFLPHMLKIADRVFAYNTDELLMDIGTPARLKKAQKSWIK